MSLALADALASLERAAQAIPTHVNPATASLYAVSPLPCRGIATLFMTHPRSPSASAARARRRSDSRHDDAQSAVTAPTAGSARGTGPADCALCW